MQNLTGTKARFAVCGKACRVSLLRSLAIGVRLWRPYASYELKVVEGIMLIRTQHCDAPIVARVAEHSADLDDLGFAALRSLRPSACPIGGQWFDRVRIDHVLLHEVFLDR